MTKLIDRIIKSARRLPVRPSLVLSVMLVLSLTLIGGQAVKQFSSANPAVCATCHNMQPYVDSYQSSNHLDNVHRQANIGCQDCHTDYTLGDEIKSAWHYVRGDYQTPLKRRTFDQAMCTRCHISLQYLAGKTDFLVRNPHLSHWPDLVCSDCHLAHEPQIDYCSYCHDNGGQRLTGEPIVPRADNPWARPTLPAMQTP